MLCREVCEIIGALLSARDPGAWSHEWLIRPARGGTTQRRIHRMEVTMIDPNFPGPRPGGRARTSPKQWLDDYRRLMKLANYEAAPARDKRP